MQGEMAAIERRALATSRWANLGMAITGVLAAWLSRSDALLVDDLSSGVNFVAAIIAARVAIAVRRPADRRYPFGYDGYEALYVTGRSMALAGVLAFAALGAVGKITTYMAGGAVPVLVLGPILVYGVAMLAICLWLAWRNHRAWTATGRTSDLLRTERRSAAIDGLLSAASAAALLASPLLLDTAFGGLVPVADAVIVLAMALALFPGTLSTCRAALRETAGAAVSPEIGAVAQRYVDRALTGASFWLVELSVTKIGRTHFVVAYLDPTMPVGGAAMDAVRATPVQAFADIGAPVRCEVVTTATSPFSDPRGA